MNDAQKLAAFWRIMVYVKPGDETLETPDLLAALLERANADYSERGI